jgi:hypothetical protein
MAASGREALPGPLERLTKQIYGQLKGRAVRQRELDIGAVCDCRLCLSMRR